MTYRQISKFLLAGLIVLLSFMFLVNVSSPAPTFEKIEGRITRYYHNNANPVDSGKPLAFIATALLNAYTVILGGRGFFAYQFLNILIYALIWPGLMLFLTYWALGPVARDR